jgi:hypothetical protein
MLAGAMERRIRTEVGAYQNWPNLYVMLVGPPGSGKGVIDIVLRLWRDTRNELGFPAFYVGVDDSTKAALVDALNEADQTHVKTNYKYHNLLLPVEEFSNFFAKYEPELLSFLTRIFNAPDEYQEGRRKNGKTIIVAPLITALLGYQPELMNKIMQRDAADQGFLRRTILIWNQRADKNLLFEASPLNEKLKKDITTRLGEISTLCGVMNWDHEASNFLQNWDLEDGPPRPVHDSLQYYLETRTQHVIKLSMVASMSESTSMTIGLRHVERALSWLLEAESLMPEIFEYMKGESDSRLMKGLLAHLLKQGSDGHPITDAMIVAWLSDRATATKIRPVITTLELMGTLTRKPDGTWRITGRPV